MINLTSTLDLLELVWCVMAVIGIGSHLKGWIEAQRDLNTLRDTGANGARKRIAKGDRRDERVRIVKQLFFLFVGIIAATRVPSPYELTSFITRIGFIGVEIAMVYVSIMRNLDRSRLAQEVEAHIRATIS